MVPKGDYSQQKLIIGKYTAMNSTPFVYTEPLDTMIEVKGESMTGTVAMVANGTNLDADIVEPTMIKIFETNRGPYLGFDRLGISADFQAWLEPFDTVAGSYGLRLYIYTDETDTSVGATDDTEGVKKERIYSMTLSNSDMYGNPYNFEGFFTQSKVFDISDINHIKKVEIWMFQNGDFIDGNKNYIPHGSILSDTGQFQLFSDNIFIKNVKLYIGYDENDFDKDTLILFTDDSLTYNNRNEDATANKKRVNARWIHKREDGKFELLEQTDGVNTILNWYRYDYGKPAADKYSGVYWDKVNYEHTIEADTSAIIQNLDTFYFMFYPGNSEGTYIVGMQVPYTNGNTYTIDNYDRSLLRYWAPECLEYYGISRDTANKAWAYTSISSLHIDSQTWSEIFHSRMVWHESNYLSQVQRNDGYNDRHIGGSYYPVGCMHPISFWELFTTAYKFYWSCPEEFEKINFNGEVFNGGNIISDWDLYRGKNPYTELSYSGSTVYANADYTAFTLGTNNQAFKNLLIAFTNSFGEWALVEDAYGRKDLRPVDHDVYTYLYEQTELFFAKMDDPTYTFTSDLFYYDFDPDITKQQEQIKVIGLVKSGELNGVPTYTPYYSNLLIFENEQEVANQATIDAASALQIVFDDGSDGNYFIYDQNGRLNNDSEGRGKNRTMRVLYHGAEITRSMGITSIEWHIPKDWSMMAIDDEHCTLADKETFYEGTRKSYTSLERKGNNLKPEGSLTALNITQQYYIKDYWSSDYSNNTVECIVVIDQVPYTAVKEVQFGKAGTTGTNVTLVLSFEGNRNSLSIAGLTVLDEELFDVDDERLIDQNDSVLTAAGVSDAFATINAKLYDSANNEINLEAMGAEIEWGWKDEYVNPYMELAPSPENPYNAVVNLKQSLSNQTVPIDNYSVVQAKIVGWVTGNGTFDLIAFLPVPIKTTNDYKYISGTKEVIYDSQGTPHYSALPYQLYLEADQRVNTTWGIKSPNRDSYGTQGSSFKYYHEVKQTRNGYTFQALNFYVSDSNKEHSTQNYCCVFAQHASTGEILWSQPIVITQNQYDFAMLNQWDGNLTIDENNGTILSKMIGAGKKNSNNTFSGILMGDVKAGTNNNMESETGLYGFQDGVMTFQLKESGEAIFGASGHGQITINGTSGTIESATYNNNIPDERRGMSLDLDDGILDIIDRTQWDYGNNRLEIKLQPYSPFFKVTSPRGTDLIHIGTDAYYLRSDNYEAYGQDGSGLNLDLKNGRLDAYNFKLVSGKVVFDSTEGDNHPYFYVRNRAGNNFLIYLGPDGNYIASNDYTSGSSGMIIDLESSRIVGRGLYIQGTSSGGSNFTLNASDGSYPLTIGSYFKVDWSGQLSATKATLEQATINNATINNATIQNLNGGTNVNINENFTVSPNGSCTASNITATGTGQIGPYRISSDGLTGKGIVLGENYIQIGSVRLEAGMETGTLYVSGGLTTGGDINARGAVHCRNAYATALYVGGHSEDEGDGIVDAAHVANWVNMYNWYKNRGWETTDGAESNYATKQWVENKGYATETWVNQNFADKNHNHDGVYQPAGNYASEWHSHSGYAGSWLEDHVHTDSAGGQTGGPYRNYSSIRYKTEVNDLTLNLDDFRAVSFKYKEPIVNHHTDDDRIHYGFIAEELEEVNPDLVIYDEEGQPDMVDYQAIIALCVKEIQELKQEICELKEKINND